MAGLIEHLEGFLGPIQAGWAERSSGRAAPFQVASFRRGGPPGVVTFCTVGLSNFGLASPPTGRTIRLELLMMVMPTLHQGRVPALLEQVGSGALATGRALLRGDVVGPAGPLVFGSSMEALYVGMPVCLPDEFAQFEEGGRAVVVAWLIPISVAEARYVDSHGWDAFEDRLVEFDPDLTDLNRTSTF